MLAAASLAGCAGQADIEQLQNEQFRLRGMIATQNQQIQGLQQQIRRQHDEIEELIHGGGAGAGGGGLSDQVASQEERLNKLEATVSALQASAATSVAPPSTSPAAPAPSAPSAPAGPPAWQADLDKELGSAKSVSGPGAKPYREGLQAMKDAKYALAVAKFTQLQKRSPKSALNEPGEYFSANALFELGKSDQSILQFSDLVMRFPRGRFACAALLREAQAFLRLNDKIDARFTLRKLLADHGDCAEGSAANAMMKDLEN